METINDRMEQLINERFNGNKSAFAKAIDVTPSLMSSYLSEKRRSKPSIDMVIKICECLGVNAYWLLTGKGEQYPSSSSPVNTGAITSSRNVNIASTIVSPAHTVPPSSSASPLPCAEASATDNSSSNPERVSEVSALRQQIKLMQQLLGEKERLIRVLMETRPASPSPTGAAGPSAPSRPR